MRSDGYAIIMAGGRGERFWPLSSDLVPKPFVSLLGDKTMIQETVERIAAVIPPRNVLLVLSAHHLPVAREQLPGIPAENFIVEPMGRDTAACIGLASLHVEKRGGDVPVVILPADHRIPGEKAFAEVISAALAFLRLREESIITLGIRPTRPETGYGYLEAGEKLEQLQNVSMYRVTRFVEKPDAVTAEHFLLSDRHYWNSGMVIAGNATLQQNLGAHMPELWRGMERIRAVLGTGEEHAVAQREFFNFKKVSVDYGVLEKSKQVSVIPAHFEWDDLGTWNALARVCAPDASGNVAVGRRVVQDTGGCIIYNTQDQLIATLGVRDLVIVQARGKVLVCHKDKAPLLKELMPMLGEDER